MNDRGWDYAEKQPLYNMIPFLRFTKLKDNHRLIAQSLEDHLEWWMEDREFLENYKPVVNFIINNLHLDYSQEDVLRVITNSYTNDFSFNMDNGNQVRTTSFDLVHLFCPL